MTARLTAPLLPLVFFGLLACSACGEPDEPPLVPEVDTTDTRTWDLARVLGANDELARFTFLVEQAELTETLRHDGPLTVFAPRDEAFRNLPLVLDSVVASQARDTIAQLLRLHIARGHYDLGRVRDSLRISTLLEVPLLLARGQADSTLRAGGHRVLATHQALNGVIHVLGTVLSRPLVDSLLADSLRADSLARPPSSTR